MHIGIIYFSATGVTELVSKHISSVLENEGHTTQLKNILTLKIRQSSIDFEKFDMIFFGFPVFGGRAPKIAEDWISSLDGKNQKCSMFFTYGARDLELAHQATYYLLTQSNFQVVLSAEFIGRHSFNVGKGWSLAEGRPNQLDFNVTTEFAIESLKRFQKDIEFKVDLSGFSYKKKRIREARGVMVNFYPSRGEDDCSMCSLCEKECPVEAFNAISGETNRKLCIQCMHCVTICPDKILRIGDVSQIFQKGFIDKLGLTEDVVEKKKSKIIFKIIGRPQDSR